MTYSYQPWPSWAYGPDGAAAIFEREEDVPAGWSHHDTVKGGKPQLDHDHDGKTGRSVSGSSGDDLKALREEYQDRFGKRPFMGWDASVLREKLAS